MTRLLHLCILLLLLVLSAAVCLDATVVREINLINNNVYVKMENNGTHTTFYVSSALDKANNVNPGDAWLALGLNDAQMMVIFRSCLFLVQIRKMIT